MKTWIISNLGAVPHFTDAVADRGWTAWWKDSGLSLADYRKHLNPMMVGDGSEQGFVAHAGDTYLGSVLLIENDLELRPRLTPWVAALWVDADQRHRGIATGLVEAARHEAARQGRDKVYLCAVPSVSAYYLKRGWRALETDVAGLNVFESDTR